MVTFLLFLKIMSFSIRTIHVMMYIAFLNIFHTPVGDPTTIVMHVTIILSNPLTKWTGMSSMFAVRRFIIKVSPPNPRWESSNWKLIIGHCQGYGKMMKCCYAANTLFISLVFINPDASYWPNPPNEKLSSHKSLRLLFFYFIIHGNDKQDILWMLRWKLPRVELSETPVLISLY